jgi:hypothetical protein
VGLVLIRLWVELADFFLGFCFLLFLLRGVNDCADSRNQHGAITTARPRGTSNLCLALLKKGRRAISAAALIFAEKAEILPWLGLSSVAISLKVRGVHLANY